MQKSVLDFIEKYSLRTDAQTRYIDLVSEVGELGKEFLLCTNYGKNQAVLNEKIADEIGDCIFSLMALCCELEVDFEMALQNALAKYEKRFNSKGSVGSDE